MICPKCKTELPDNTIRCPKCGIKVNIVCPDCKTLNPLGTVKCINCQKELLKICPECKSYNTADAIECRKCHAKLSDTAENTVNQPESNIVIPFSSRSTNYNINNMPLNPAENIDSEVQKENTETEKIFSVDESQSPVDFDEIFDNRQNESQEQDTDDIKIDSVEDIVVDVNDSLENEKSDSNDVNQENSVNEKDEEVYEEILNNIEIQSESVNKAINIIKTSIDKHIIAINGNEGSGKSAVLKQVTNYLADNGFICLFGSLTPLLQITSFGFFQDAFLRMMGFPPFIKNTETFIRDFKRSKFSKIFNCLNNKELNLFLNMFYPSKEDNFENILENKKIIFSILEKVITSLLINNNLIIAIDNFELLDGASYDFIVHLIERGYLSNRLKLIVAYQEKKTIQSYFDLTQTDEKIFETIIIKKFKKDDLIKAVIRSTGVDITKILPDNVTDGLVKKADSNAIRMEQEAALLFDLNYITLENENITVKEENKPEIAPETFEELIKLRLNSLSPIIKNMLFLAAAMGYRFSTAVLSSSLEIDLDKTQGILDFLSKELFINAVDNFTYEFKSLTLWKIIYKEAKSDSLYKENTQRLYNVLKPLILSSNLQKLISCSEALNKREEYEIWLNTSRLASKLGDTNLYVISQKQCLKLLDELNLPDNESIKERIYEETGKLLSEKSPQEAVTYLSNVLDIYIKEGNIKKIIDLSGYFVRSCYLTGNYFGVAEAVDAVISSLSGSINISNLEISLIKTRKLNALLNIGNTEQIAVTVNEELIPDLESVLNMPQQDNTYIPLIINAWLEAKLTLAKAYAIQGNKEISDILSNIKEFMAKYNCQTDYYITQVNILEAAACTVSGQINNSDEILNNISNEYKTKKMETDILAQWNLLNIINRVLLNQTDGIKSDLFELAAFTNNINEHSLKNIVKLILGYILKEEGNKDKALEIFNEEITYFAKEKVAIGAMLSWALIIRMNMDMGDFDKALNTAVKSLEIAQSPKINNYFFSIYFQKFIAEIYTVKKDFIAAKMYLEKAIMIAKQFELKYQLTDLYLTFGKYMEDFMQSDKIYTPEYIQLTSEMYNKALAYARELKLQNMMEKAVKYRASFKVYCQLNSINL